MYTFFLSKRDNSTTIRTVILLTIAFIFFSIMMVQIHGKNNVFLGLLILLEAVYVTGVLLALRTTYKVTDEGILIIHAGLRKIRIHISDIHSAVIQHSYDDFITSPFASSVYQVKLSYKKYSAIVISPANQREFIHSLQLHNPAIAAETGTYAV